MTGKGQFTVPQRRLVLRRMQFTRDEASELASRFGLTPDGDGRKVDSYINALARSSVDFTKVLRAAYLEDLRFACDQLGLDATEQNLR